MIPKELTIQGLYSYQEKQTIDFTKLSSSSLFGIFGQVGSGKSAILEAITFALYNKIERLGGRDQRAYNMMNLKSNEMFIEFIFEAGKDNSTFRVVSKSKRNKKNFEDITNISRDAYLKERESWKPIDIQILESEIGLSYENFKRTIIIPQGKFQEFLELGDTERTKMMKDLFHLERFDLSQKVSSLESQNRGVLQNINGQLQQLGDINPDQKEQYEKNLTQFEKDIKEKTSIHTDRKQKDKLLSELLSLTKKMEESRKLLQDLNSQKPEYDSLEINLSQYEECQTLFKNPLENLNSSLNRIEQKKKQLDLELVKLNEIETQLKGNNERLTEIKPDYDKLDVIKQQVEDLGNIIRIKTLDEGYEKNSIKHKEATEQLNKINNLIEVNKLEKGKTDRLIGEKEKLLPDISVLGEIKVWHVSKKNLIKNRNELEGEIENIQNEIKEVNSSVQTILKTSIYKGVKQSTVVSEALEFLQNKISHIKEINKDLNKNADHYRLQEKLKDFAGELENEKPCPLCGSMDHPDIIILDNVAEALTEIIVRMQENENQIIEINETINKLNKFDSNLAIRTGLLAGKLGSQDKLIKDITRLESEFKWEDKYRNEQTLLSDIDTSNQIKEEIIDLKTKSQNISGELGSLEIQKEDYQTDTNKTQILLTKGQAEIDILKEGLIVCKYKDYHEKQGHEIEAERSKLQAKHQKVSKEYQEITDQIDGLKGNQSKILGSREANLKTWEEEKLNRDNLLIQIQASLDRTKFSDLDEIKGIIARNLDIKSERSKLNKFRQDIVHAIKITDQLEKEKGDRKYDLAAHQKIKEEILTLDNELDTLKKELGKVAGELTRLNRDLATLQDLKVQKDALELRAENLKTLTSLFRGSGFVNYISSIYLQNLCKAANDRFVKLTRQSLSLEITGDNDFQVRDFMNGGVVRSVKTLSGGQTFQAALSLALALSDNIQHLAGADQNFFFLDEGFGSLDKESLYIVFDTLKTLRKENRIVGLISHVEEMQEEMDTYLQITNHPETGSKIQASWESYL